MARIDEYLKRAREVWDFRGAVLVAQNGSVLYKEAFGIASVEKNLPNTAATKFLIGSITKTFTAIAIMQLVEERILELDQPISSYLRNYQIDSWNKITIRHLLSHTSGIPDYKSLPDFQRRARESTSVKDVIEIFKNEPLLFEPGSKQLYGSPGYLLLGVIIENVTGMTYQNYIKKYVADVAGMSDTDIYEDYRSRPDFAIGYFKDPEGRLIEAEPLHFPIAYSAGGLSSTSHDLYLLDRALSETILLDSTSINIMFTSVEGEYGCGFAVRNLGRHKIVGHDGSAPGFCASFQRWPNDSLCVIILSNNASIPVPLYNVADALAAIVLEKSYELPGLKSPIRKNINELAEYEGVYQEENGTYHVIGLVGHRLAERTNNGVAKTILPESRDIFYYEQDFMTTLTFSRNIDGDISRLTHSRLFDERFAYKVSYPSDDSIACNGAIISVPISILKRYEGSYQFSPNAPNWNILVKENRLFAQAAELPAIELLPLSERTFCIKSLGVKVVFNQGNNRITGLTYIDQGTKHNARKISDGN